MRARRQSRGGASASTPTREQILLPRVFNALMALFPTFKSSTVFDQDPPPILNIMIQRSQALEAIATLLRTDSFDEVVSKFELYNMVFEVIGKMAQYPQLLVLITGPRILYPTEVGLLRTSIPSSNDVRKEAQSVTVSTTRN
jgi:hypothetical protein